MGKSKKQRTVRRHNPVRVPENHLPKGLKAAEATSTKKDAVLPIIQKLESSNTDDRTWACSAVSNLISNDPSTRRLLQGKNIVGVLIKLLSDSSDEVVAEAAGALRNLCIDGGYDICAEMYNKGILTPLKDAVFKISRETHQALLSPKKDSKAAHALLFRYAENVITILWCLSETSNKALTAINKLNLVPFLLAFLENRNQLPLRTVVAAAQCLYVLTDENDEFIEEVRSDSGYTSTLLTTAESSTPTGPLAQPQDSSEDMLVNLWVLAAGTLRNISPIPAPSAASAIDVDQRVVLPRLLPTLQSCSPIEASNRVVELLSQEESKESAPPPIIKGVPKSDHQTQTELELERIERRLRTTQLALEILTGICATLPDPTADQGEEAEQDVEVDMEEGEGDGDGEGEEGMPIDAMEDDVMDADAEPPIGEAQIEVDSDNPPNATTSSLLPTLIEPLLPLIRPTPLSFPPTRTSSVTTTSESPSKTTTPATTATTLPTHLPTTSALSSIHLRALECLNNIFLSLATAPPPHISANLPSGLLVWSTIWSALELVLAGVDFTNNNKSPWTDASGSGSGWESRKEMWEVAVGVLWGIGTVWKGKIVPEEAQVQVLIRFCQAGAEQGDDELTTKCIGTLECLAHHPTSLPTNSLISTFLLSLLPPTNPHAAKLLSATIQAASALIDIYSDETVPYDVNFREGRFLEGMAGSVEGVRRVVRGVDRRREGGRELRMKGDEVVTNLVAFVKYRRGLKL